MIQKHYNLTCFVLEYPITILHSFLTSQFIYLVSSDSNIFQFDLSQPNHYQKIEGQQKFKQIKRTDNLIMTLDNKNNFCIRQNEKQLLKQSQVQDFKVVKANQHTFIVFLKEDSNSEGLFVLQVFKEEGQQFKMQMVKFKLQEHNDEDQETLPPIIMTQKFAIKAFLHHYCICQTQSHTFIIKLLFNNINTMAHTIPFKCLPFELHHNIQIKSSFMDKIIAQQNKKTYFIDLQRIKIQEMSQLALPQKEFIVYNNFLIQIQHQFFLVLQIIKGNIIGKISISSILQQFQEGSSIIFNQQFKQNALLERYCFIYGQIKPKISHFYIFDKEKTALYYFNINKLLERTFIQDIKESLKVLENDSENIHQKIIKTLSFRNKKIQALQKYIMQDLKNQGFANTIRFLAGQQNIFVMNDGLKLFYNTLIRNLQKLTNKITDFQELERQIIKLCAKLITESKYEDHLENALFILNNMYTTLRKHQLLNSIVKNQQYYQKLFDSKKIIKLLRQDKMKKLFELSYELCLKIKGFKSYEQLSKN